MIVAPPRRSSRVRFSAATSEAPPRAAEASAAWASLPGGVVDGGEIVILAIKPSMWRPLFDSIPWLIMCGGFAIALASLSRPLAGLSQVGTAQVILLLAFARVGLAVVRWVPRWHVLTNRRIIDIRGVRKPRISACSLVDVRNTYLHAAAADKLAGLGTITFVTDSADRASQVWQSIAEPEEVHAKVRRAIEAAIDRHGFGS